MSVANKRKPRFRVGDAASFLYGPRRVRGEIIEDRGPLAAYGRRIYLVQATLGQEEATTFEIPEDDLDDPAQATEDEGTPGTRVEFSVTYVRRGKTNQWDAQIKRGRVYQGVKAKGAVAYSTARRDRESQRDERHGIVAVFWEPHPDCNEATMGAEVRHFADRMFKERHPDAEIEN